MSEHSIAHLVGNTAIGLGYRPWWADSAERQGLALPIHAGFVPTDVVTRVITEDIRTEPLIGATTQTPINKHVRVYNHVTGDTLQVAGEDYVVHLPQDWCWGAALPLIEAAKDEGLGVFSVISLGGGKQSAITLAYQDSARAADMELKPYTMFSTGVGFATQLNNGMTAPVCDNTIAMGRESGTKMTVRHTPGSKWELEALIRAGLDMHGYQVAIMNRIEMLAAMPVTPGQWDQVIEGFFGAADPDASPQAKAIRSNSETRIRNMYNFDPRCEPWAGTALGAFQTINTYQQHVKTVIGQHRAERNAHLAISGKQNTIDNETLTLIGNVIGKELVEA
jgi:hypothetical protein